jgi:phage terminase large subunit
LIEIDYAPRRQFIKFHMRSERWAVLVCHRRAGKTVANVNDMIAKALQSKLPDSRYAFIFPQRNQAKDAAWKYVRQYSRPAWRCEPYENDLRVELLNGSSIRLYGADNPDALRGAYLDGVVLDEFSQMKPEVWNEVVRPMLADRKGWATFVATPKGKNEFFRLYQNALKDQNWFHMMLRASESGIMSPEELADLKREMLPDEYAQEFECARHQRTWEIC